MFTGIVEEVGKICSIQRIGPSIRLTVNARSVLQDIKAGDSIAVNGICLTAVEFTGSSFMADVMHETVSRTSLSQLKQGSPVNLERAMQLNGRFGGHIVTGHIDGTGTIVRIQRDSIAVWYTIKTDAAIMRYIIQKGSVAIDGISLTVADLTADSFRVCVIPHTLEHTALAEKRLNSMVNLENDCVGKYIEKLLFGKKDISSKITREFLAGYGY